MISLTSQEKTFLKKNKEILSVLFTKRIEDLKEQILVCSPEETETMKKMINEFKSWLLTIKIFSKPKKEKKDNFI